MFEILHIIHHVYSHDTDSEDEAKKDNPPPRPWVPMVLVMWYVWELVSWVMRSIVLYNLESGGAGQCAMDSALSSNDVVVLTSVSLGINLVVLWVTGRLQYVPTALKIGFDKVCARS